MIVADRRDYNFAEALSVLWFSNKHQYKIIKPADWQWRYIEGQQPGGEPRVLFWRVYCAEDIGEALLLIRKGARLLCPVVFYGIARPPGMEALHSYDVISRVATPLWWIPPDYTEYLACDKIVALLRAQMPKDWPALVVPETSIEEAERRIIPFCDTPVIIRRGLHGFSRGRNDPEILRKYINRLSWLAPAINKCLDPGLAMRVGRVVRGDESDRATIIVLFEDILKAIRSKHHGEDSVD